MKPEQLAELREVLEEVVMCDAIRGFKCHFKPCTYCLSCRALILLDELSESQEPPPMKFDACDEYD